MENNENPRRWSKWERGLVRLGWIFCLKSRISWLEWDFDFTSLKTRDLAHKKGRSVSVWDRMGYKHQQESGIGFSYARFFKNWDFSFFAFIPQLHSHIGPKRRLKTSGFGKIRIFPKVFEENRRYQTERHKKVDSNLEFERWGTSTKKVILDLEASLARLADGINRQNGRKSRFNPQEKAVCFCVGPHGVQASTGERN